jgi:signal transduction histidine kinase
MRPFANDIRRPRIFDAEGNPMGPPSQNVAVDPAALRLALNGQEGFSEVVVDQTRYRVFSMPRRDGPNLIGAVQVVRDLSEVELLRSGQILTLLLLLPVALAACGLGAFFLASRVLKPVGDLTAAANEISATDLTKRLPVIGNDEFARLTQTFNAMVARLEESFQTLNEAYERQKRFTADAAHELRTPLTRLRLATSSALEGSGDLHEALETADRATVAMSKLVDQLLILAQADARTLSLQHVALDLRVPVSDALFGLECKVQLPEEPVMVLGNGLLLQRMTRNLAENAIRYSTASHPPEVSVSVVHGEALIVVEDHGEGIAPEHLPHIFERFYRVDEARSRGSGAAGLGLSICRSIAESLGGRIEAHSTVGSGSIFTVHLPLLKS